MKRRDLFKGALAGAGAITAGAQTADHAAHTDANKASAAVPPRAAWKPLLFDDHQNETVMTLAELIIPKTDTPGARDARVNEYIDLILKEGAADRRTRFIEGLGWLDGYAIRQHGQPFINCSADQQTAILKGLDGAQDRALHPGADFFRQMKQLTVQGYYTSRQGIAELNKGHRVPGSFACAHEGKH